MKEMKNNIKNAKEDIMMNEAKSNQNNEMNEDNSAIKMLIMRVITDEDFKQKLIEDMDSAVEEYELTEIQRILIKSLSPQDLENLTPESIEEYFSADAAVYTPDEGADLNEFDSLEGDDLLSDDE